LTDDITNIEAARARIKKLREQRLAERIEAGEIVSVPLYVVAGSQTAARARVEQAKAAKLAEMHAAGDQREVVFTGTVVVTGVVQHGEAADPASVPSAPSFSSPEDAAIRPPLPSPVVPRLDDDEKDVSILDTPGDDPQPPVIETYVCVQTRQCADDDDPGAIAEGWFSIDGKVVTVTNASGKYVGSRTMLKGEDARVVAKALLREKTPESESFNRRLSYPNAGLA
jgi:hypothetical protein